MKPPRALLIGYGNPGRGDDGLGPAFAQRIADMALPGLDVDIDFQLSADHALAISEHDLVIFADADMACTGPYAFTALAPATPGHLGSHSVTPEAAMALSSLLFAAAPPAYLLGIAGAQFGKIEEGLSEVAAANLDLAEGFFKSWYQTRGQEC